MNKTKFKYIAIGLLTIYVIAVCVVAIVMACV